MKIINGWVESVPFKLLGPLIPVVLVALLAWGSGFISDVRDTKNTVSGLCSSVADIRISADKLKTVADSLVLQDAVQRIEIENLKKIHDWASPHIKSRGDLYEFKPTK